MVLPADEEGAQKRMSVRVNARKRKTNRKKQETMKRMKRRETEMRYDVEDAVVAAAVDKLVVMCE